MRTVVIITESKSYLVHSIKTQLEENGYDTMVLSIQEAVKVEITGEMVGVFVYVDNTMLVLSKTLTEAKDKFVKASLPIFIADNNDIIELDKAFTTGIAQKVYMPPFDVKVIVKELVEYFGVNLTKTKKTILIVDDSGPVLRSLKACLESKYQVIPANSGAMAIKYISLNKPDLVLLDYNMPVVDGKQVLAMIRSESEFCDIPVIFLTSRGDKESIMGVMELKPNGYLLKTLPLPKIFEAVNNFFEKQN